MQLIKVVSRKIDDNEQNLWHNILRRSTHAERFQKTKLALEDAMDKFRVKP